MEQPGGFGKMISSATSPPPPLVPVGGLVGRGLGVLDLTNMWEGVCMVILFGPLSCGSPGHIRVSISICVKGMTKYVNTHLTLIFAGF